MPRSSWALIATTIALNDIRTAPTAGCSTIPHGASVDSKSLSHRIGHRFRVTCHHDDFDPLLVEATHRFTGLFAHRIRDGEDCDRPGFVDHGDGRLSARRCAIDGRTHHRAYYGMRPVASMAMALVPCVFSTNTGFRMSTLFGSAAGEAADDSMVATR